MRDRVIPFLFETIAVRGALVQLDATWQRLQRDHNYSLPVAGVLGNAAAATVLIAQSLKFKGSVTLQINGDGPLGMLVMQCTHELDLRGMATATATRESASFADLTAGSRCAVTVDAGALEQPYQGIVEIQADSLAASLEKYFAQSVQVPSHLMLVRNPSFCGGLLVQQMAGEKALSPDDWRRIGLLMATLRAEELGTGASPDLLHKLFAEDDLRVFAAQPVRFCCRCSQSKVENVLRLLGEAEVREELEQRGHIDVTCEYCGELRRFDPVDLRRVFAGTLAQGNSSIH